MIRQTTYLAVLVLVGAACWVGSSHSARTTDVAGVPQASAAPFVHVVVISLKKDAPEGEADALITDAHEMLRPIPTVRDLRAGKPDEKATSPLAKKDFSVALLLLFDNHDDLQTYSNHPSHLKYVQKHMKYIDTTKLLVYDFVNQKR